jgi:hypothetical protein
MLSQKAGHLLPSCRDNPKENADAAMGGKLFRTL